MSDDVTKAWSAVGEQFSALGRAMRERYRASEDAGPGAPVEGDSRSGALKAALDQLAQALQDVADRATAVAKDPDVSECARQVGRAVESAVGQTVDLVGHEVDDLVRRARRDGRSDDAGPPAG